jgi:2-iminobutanoate/2-iminopropanoate deaminase
MKTIINTPNAPKPIGPYSQGILVNGMLFVAGQIPVNPKNGELIKEGIRCQTNQVMLNIQAILKEAGMDFSHVVKASLFLSDMNNFDSVNDIYASFFQGELHARECIQAAKLPKGVDVEISVIAVK